MSFQLEHDATCQFISLLEKLNKKFIIETNYYWDVMIMDEKYPEYCQ